MSVELDDAALEKLAELVAERLAVAKAPALLSIPAVARELSCHTRTVYRRIEDGLLLAVLENDHLMVRADDLRDYIDALEQPQRAPQSRRRRRSNASRYARIVKDRRS